MVDGDEIKLPNEDEKKLTTGYYFLKMLPPGLLFILAVAVYLCCTYLFLRIFFAINPSNLDASIVFGEYSDPLRAVFVLILGLMGGLIIFFLLVALFFMLTSLFFPSRIMRQMFIKNANISYARVIKLWDDDLKKTDDRCDADVVVAPRESDNFRARVKVPVGSGHNIERGTKIIVAYSFAKNKDKVLEKIISVTRYDLTSEQFQALLKPPEEGNPEEQAPEAVGMSAPETDAGAFEAADFTMMETTDGDNLEAVPGEFEEAAEDFEESPYDPDM